MDRSTQIESLKQLLLRDVASLFRRRDIRWRHAITEMVRDLKSADVPAVIFGGTLRSLLLGRLGARPRFGRPRDLDFVVANISLDALKERLQEHLVRQTRFGGLQLQRSTWHFDIWPVDQTWAIQQDESLEPRFESLPSTTFFNLEAVAVEAWTEHGRARTLYSGDDRFFHGILDQTIEINREENPFPALCVVRSLVLASKTHFWLGPRLARYLAVQRERLSDADLRDAQQRHYGAAGIDAKVMRKWLEHIAVTHDREQDSRIKVLIGQQLPLWDDVEEDITTRLRVNFSVCQTRRTRGKGN